MGGHAPDGGHRSAAVAALACLLVVGASLAVAPGTAAAAHVDGEIVYNGADGELTVDVDVRQASSGGFTGNGSETVTIDVAGESFERTESAGGSSTYTYTVSRSNLSSVLERTDGAGTRVTVSHDGEESFNATVDIRYVALDGNVEFTGDGRLRLGVRESFGVPQGGTVPIQVETDGGTQDANARYEDGDTASLTIDRGTLGDLELLANPQGATIEGGEPYVRESANINVRSAGRSRTTGERLSAGGVEFTSPLFEDGRRYAVNVSSPEGQYVRTLEASGQSIGVASGAVAAEREVTLTVVDDATGSQVVRKQITFPTETLNAFVNGTTTVEFNESLPGRASDGNATVWVQGESGGADRYEATLNVTRSTVEFSESPAWPNQSRTSLLISDSDGSTLHADLSLQGTSKGPDDSENNDQQFLGRLPGWVPIVGATILGVVVVAGGVFAALSLRDSKTGGSFFGSSKQTAPGRSPGTATVDVGFEVFDEKAGSKYPDANRVIAKRRNQADPVGAQGGGGRFGAANSTGRSKRRTRDRSQGVNRGSTRERSQQSRGASTESERIDIVAGEGEAKLEGGRWVFEVRENGRTIGTRTHRVDPQLDKDRVVLSVDPYTVDVTVTDGPEREPRSGVTVEATADTGRWDGRKPTDASGTVVFEVPRSATEVRFVAQHPGRSSVESTYRVEQAAQDGAELAIGAETGTVAVETVVGDRPWPGLSVQITPVSEDAKAYTERRTVTTDSDSKARVELLPAGEYEVSADPTLTGVDTTAAVESVRVTDGGTTEVTLSIDVSYSMTAAQQERLAELRDRVGDLTAATNRDVAIPRYYGTVLTSVLGMVDEIESAPERAVEMEVSPDEAVTALLDAAEAGIRTVDGAMSERRNVKLFGDCASMSPAEIDWTGEATLDAFLDRVAEGGDRGRRGLRDRLRETDEVLDDKWGEVNEIAPARKLHDRIGELAQETGDIDDELAVVAQTYVGICLLDAVGEIFDHAALVKRLNSGSY